MPKKVATEPAPEKSEVEVPATDTGMSIEQMTAAQAGAAVNGNSAKKRGWIAWLLLLLVLIALVCGAYFGRNYVVQIWPGSATAYHYLQIDVETQNQLRSGLILIPHPKSIRVRICLQSTRRITFNIW